MDLRSSPLMQDQDAQQQPEGNTMLVAPTQSSIVTDRFKLLCCLQQRAKAWSVEGPNAAYLPANNCARMCLFLEGQVLTLGPEQNPDGSKNPRMRRIVISPLSTYIPTTNMLTGRSGRRNPPTAGGGTATTKSSIVSTANDAIGLMPAIFTSSHSSRQRRQDWMDSLRGQISKTDLQEHLKQQGPLFTAFKGLGKNHAAVISGETVQREPAQGNRIRPGLRAAMAKHKTLAWLCTTTPSPAKRKGTHQPVVNLPNGHFGDGGAGRKRASPQEGNTTRHSGAGEVDDDDVLFPHPTPTPLSFGENQQLEAAPSSMTALQAGGSSSENSSVAMGSLGNHASGAHGDFTLTHISATPQNMPKQLQHRKKQEVVVIDDDATPEEIQPPLPPPPPPPPRAPPVAQPGGLSSNAETLGVPPPTVASRGEVSTKKPMVQTTLPASCWGGAVPPVAPVGKSVPVPPTASGGGPTGQGSANIFNGSEQQSGVYGCGFQRTKAQGPTGPGLQRSGIPGPTGLPQGATGSRLGGAAPIVHHQNRTSRRGGMGACVAKPLTNTGFEPASGRPQEGNGDIPPASRSAAQRNPVNAPVAPGAQQVGIDTVINSVATNKPQQPTAKKKGNTAGGGGGDDDEDGDDAFGPELRDPDGTIPEGLRKCDPKLLTMLLREVTTGHNVTWADIAGLKHAQDLVTEVIVWPMKNKSLFNTKLLKPPRGLLLFGPPGTGKTMIARAIASEAHCTFFNISASSMVSKWIGEGEKLVRALFALASWKTPAVVFIDEIDSLLTMRTEGENDASRRIKTEFLVQLDGVGTNPEESLLVVGATNRPQELDEAARRRLEERLYIPLPDLEARADMVRILVRGEKHALKDPEDFLTIAKACEGFSGSDMKGMCCNTGRSAVRREVRKRDVADLRVDSLKALKLKQFLTECKNLRPSVAPEELAHYEKWNESFGSFRKRSESQKDDTSSSDDDEEEDGVPQPAATNNGQ